ncbi:MAG: hypothetical protein J6T56_04680, partial [Bacteroidales bacterium]|nr:hypothetical protein [Bacteroidales bacterium]
MKRLFLILFCLPLCLQAEECHSWDGCGLKPNAKIRTLNLFINIIYDVHPERNPCPDNNGSWNNATNEGINNEAIPSYLLDTTFMNTVYIPGRLTGCMTRVYGESSFDSLQLTGDFMVVNIKESRIVDSNNMLFDYKKIITSAVNYMNTHGGLRTLYRQDTLQHYGTSITSPPAFVQVLFRNITANHGGLSVGQGYNTTINLGNILIHDTFCLVRSNGTVQCVGNTDMGKNPTSVVCHEMAHKLFGGNEFHTTGGNHRSENTDSQMPFLNIQDGYGLMGCANSSRVGCNGYERWRMHWKHPDAPEYITARDSTNSSHLISDISRADGNRTFRLRDFVTYGDVVRIRLPYTDSSACANQYIWLENHKVGQNGKLDFLQYSNEKTCRPAGASGIYAYYQIGRDTLTETYNSEIIDNNHRSPIWYGDERDNLRQIPAEGYYDYTLVTDSAHPYQVNCVDDHLHYYYHVQGAENPFNGYSDLEDQFQPDAGDDTLKKKHERPLWRKVVGNDILDGLVNLGDNADAFSCYSHINMGTNPSTCNAKIYYNYLY